MGFKYQHQNDAFNTGRGNVSANLAKSNEEVLSQESEELKDMIPSQDGLGVNESGRKPEYATGSQPFHNGRGLGRGHGPETIQNA